MKSRNALFSCSRSVDDELRSAKPSNLVCILRTYLLTRICEYTHTKKHTERPQHSTQHMHRHPHISKSLSAAMFMLCAHMCECHQVSCQPMRFNPALAGHGDADGLADLAACQVDALLAANLWLFLCLEGTWFDDSCHCLFSIVFLHLWTQVFNTIRKSDIHVQKDPLHLCWASYWAACFFLVFCR